jgi:hypothetical protein
VLFCKFTVEINELLATVEEGEIEYDERVGIIRDVIRTNLMVTRIPVGTRLHRVSRLGVSETGWPNDVKYPNRAPWAAKT